MNSLTKDRNQRIDAMRELKKTMTLEQIGQLNGISRARVGQIIGATRIPGIPNTTRLLDIYRFIAWFQDENGYSPSIAELALEFPDRNGNKSSASVIHHWLTKMEDLKMINPRPPRISRALTLRPLDRRNPAIRELLRMEREKAE